VRRAEDRYRITDQERIKVRLPKQERLILALDDLQPDVGHEVRMSWCACLSQFDPAGAPLLSSTRDEI